MVLSLFTGKGEGLRLEPHPQAMPLQVGEYTIQSMEWRTHQHKIFRGHVPEIQIHCIYQ